jgi:hypothetical protein
MYIANVFSTSLTEAREESQQRPMIREAANPTTTPSKQKAMDSPSAASAGPKIRKTSQILAITLIGKLNP